MRHRYLRFAEMLHAATGAFCVALAVILVLAEIIIVVLRYVFSVGFVELQDFAAYCFAALVVLSIPVALVTDAHVRVDIFRENQSENTRRLFDRLAVLFLLVPVFGYTFYAIWPHIAFSWQTLEGSVQVGGLPGRFIVKTAVPLACVLLIIQGVAIAIKPAAGSSAPPTTM